MVYPLGLWSRFSGVVKVLHGYGWYIIYIYIYIYMMGVSTSHDACSGKNHGSPQSWILSCSYKRVKGRGHTVEKRTYSHVPAMFTQFSLHTY